MCSHTDSFFQFEINNCLPKQEIKNDLDFKSTIDQHLDESSPNQKKIEKIIKLIVGLNLPKSNYLLDKTDDFSIKLNKNIECHECYENKIFKDWEFEQNISSRHHICFTCLYIGCFNLSKYSHIHVHSNSKKHYISIDLTYGAIFCSQCNDYQYNATFEEVVNNLLKKENFFPLGVFFEWEPSINMIKILKSFTLNPSLSLNDSKKLEKIALRSFKIKNSSVFGLRGLINLGNTCFMNCILQTLTHTPSLRDYFLSDQHVCVTTKSNKESSNKSSYSNSKILCLVCEIVALFQEFYSGKRTPFVPFMLLHQVWTQVKHLAGYEQQDAHEFFIAALNSIHKNCIENDLNCINSNKNNMNFINYNNCYCIIDKIFTGGLQSDVICSSCGHVSTKVDPFWDISLDLYKNTTKNSTGSSEQDKEIFQVNEKFRLEDCISNFTVPETLQFSCSNCKLTKEAKKQLTMKNLPIVCCFHLKRFQKSNKIHKKISEHISFPEILDMSPYMSNSFEQLNRNKERKTPESFADDIDSKAQNKNNDSNKYFLFAVVNHHGSLESGHYTSFIRLNTHEWFKCDDHIISKASLNDVMQSEGYLLFYHKIWNYYEKEEFLN